MGTLADVISKAWKQRAYILQQRKDNPKIGLYLDDLTYTACLADPDIVSSHLGLYAMSGDEPVNIAGMQVYRVRGESPHLNVAVIPE